MNRNSLYYILFVFLFVNLFAGNNVVAQNFTVNGKVVNAETKAPVEFANIGVENTYLGTASDLDGNFQLELSNALSDKLIRISAVGFKSKSFSVKDWMDIDSVKIQLIPTNYGLSEVDVTAKSKIGYGIIKTASNLIADNYINKSYSYKCFLNTISNSEKSVSQIFLMTDKTGYSSRSFTDAFENRNYKIVENSKQSDPVGFSEGLTFIDQVLNSDIVRSPGNVLSTESVNDFEIEILGKETFEGDSVWVLSYKCNHPTIQNSGDPNAIEYSGKIWISIKSNVVLKNWSVTKREYPFVHGNDFIVPENAVKANVTYEVETTYKQEDQKYVLNTVNYKYTQDSKISNIFLKVIDVIPYDGSVVNRQYFNNAKYNEHFWTTFEKPTK